METKQTSTGLVLRLPLTENQERLWTALEHEEAVQSALATPGAIEFHAHNMDSERVYEMLPMVRRISEMRCAALRVALAREEFEKPAE